MCEIKLVKSKAMFPLIRELLEHKQRVRITVTGMSMYPFLRGDKDHVELSYADYSAIKPGAIVLAVVDTREQYILHRVLRKNKNCFYMAGDAQKVLEGPYQPEQIVAVVTGIWRNGRFIPSSHWGWRVLSFLWICFYPFRSQLIKGYRMIRHSIPFPKFGRRLS